MPPQPRTSRASKPLAFVQDPSDLIERPDLGVDLGPATPSHTVRILRPDDLVVMHIDCFDVDVVKEGAKPELVPTSDKAYLVVGFTFQHIGEQAFYEEGEPPPDTTPVETPIVPVRHRVANPSRLVFSVPSSERIEYSTVGILTALSRLPLKVAPLATPRLLARLGPDLGASILTLPGSILLRQTDDGLVLALGSVRGAKQVTSPAELIAQSTAMRTARALLSQSGAVDLSRAVADPAPSPKPRGGLAATRLGLSDLVRPVPPIRQIKQRPRAPKPDETAIEAPYRLVISPSSLGAWAHATTPQAAPADPTRIELWHSRLGVRAQRDGEPIVDETNSSQRIIRAIWARDKDGVEPTAQDILPFRMSLSGLDRVMLVRQSADPQITTPEPVDVTRLYVSSQGAWLDLHGKWNTTPYQVKPWQLPAVESWDHIAPMGRDQFVKVVYPGYLFPFGHRCSLVKITERRIDPGTTQAWLYQHKFLLVREPVRYYDDLDMPFTQVQLRPLVTPFIADPITQPLPNSFDGENLFFPIVKNKRFEFTLDCLDNDGRRVIVKTPLLFVAGQLPKAPVTATTIKNAYATPFDAATDVIPASAQSVAYAPSEKPGTTAFETVDLRFTGEPGPSGTLRSRPFLINAHVVVPAMKQLAPAAPSVDVHYAKAYLDDGFAGANAATQIMLELKDAATISFTSGGGTSKSGGFIQPDIPVRGLSRTLGTVGQTDKMVNPPPGKQPFDPLTYLDGVLPKLFGLFSLVDILRAVGLDKAPKFVTEALDQAAGWLADLAALEQAFADALSELQRDATDAATEPLRQAAAAAQTQISSLASTFTTQLNNLTTAIADFTTSGDETAFKGDAQAALGSIGATLDNLSTQLGTLSLPPVPKALLERLTGALAILRNAAEIADRVATIIAFVQGLDPANLAIKASFAWRPKLQNFPANASNDDALFYVDEDGLLLSIEARASGKDGVGVDVLAQLSNFGLNLFADATLITIGIDRLSFRSSNGRKPEVDVVMNGMEWKGVLGFIATLEELIPFDGFSDPPYVDVSESGVKAGFDLALPSIAIGVFSLENISLGADVTVPFLGDAVTIGFNFCSREKPFRLTVLCIGGGGFVGLRVSPKGIVMLEMALEACAQLAIDLGVASGSVSIAVGVYLKLEAEEGSLTGYFRIRGEVDVLGLISASITLELSLTYEFNSGKLVGRASIEVEIDIFMFSFSVSVSCERKLAGSNGDPTFAEQLGIKDGGTTLPNPGAPDGGVPAWTDYCAAFAEA
jgi:hypothetical protein